MAGASSMAIPSLSYMPEMLYRNIKTGAVIDVDSTMGGAWQAVEPAGAPAASEQPSEEDTTEKAVKKSGRTVRKSK